jgi:hypothetical protein
MILRCSLSYHSFFTFLFLSRSLIGFRSSPSALVSTRQPTLSGNRDALYRLAGTLSSCKKGKWKKKSHHRMKSIGFINYSLLCRCIIIIASSIWNRSHKSIEHRRCFFINPHFFSLHHFPNFKFWFHFVCWLVGIVDELGCWLTAFLSMKMMISVSSTQKVLCTYRQ